MSNFMFNERVDMGKRLSKQQLEAIRKAVEQGKVTAGMGRKSFDVHLHTAWSLADRGFLRMKDAYAQTVAYPTPGNDDFADRKRSSRFRLTRGTRFDKLCC